MKDLLEKGAVLQRDKETYAIAPHIPAGLVTSDQLRKLADVADKVITIKNGTVEHVHINTDPKLPSEIEW